MKLNKFISIGSIYLDVDADSVKNVFKKISTLFSKNNKEKALTIVDKLNERERLGSTGVGNGIAIPHTKIPDLKKTQVIFLKLKNSVDFSASDKKNVDIVFSIIAPENSQSEHLLILSSISNFLKNKSYVKKLRELNESKKILSLFSKS
tara:strand:+ start:761 stop:1207 length:447 start_codon:yes stop_codon:yes gene_type:complete